MNNIGPIEIGEIKDVRFDFSAEAGAQAVLSLPTVACTLFEGVDPTPSTVRVGSPTASGSLVTQRIQPGVQGCTYKLDAWATDAGGLRHHIAALIEVVSG